MSENRNSHPEKMTAIIPMLATQNYCYLTTIGRVTGKPHQIEIWFGLRNTTIYLLSGNMEGSDWVKNLRKNSSVTVRIAKQIFENVTARVVTDTDEENAARYLLAEKYNEWEDNGKILSEWARTALPVAIDLL